MSIVGNWDMVSSDNYDGVMKAAGVGIIKRKLGNSVSPRLVYIDHGNNKWTQKILSSIKNFELTCVLGQEFDDVNPADDKVKSVVTIDGNKMVHTQKAAEYTIVTTRIFNGDEMLETVECKDQVCKRVFKRAA